MVSIAKEKTFGEMSELEQLCFVFKNNGKGVILEERKYMVIKIMNRYEEMKQDNDYIWLPENAAKRAEGREKTLISFSRREGMKEGESISMKKIANKQIMKKYRISAMDWIMTLTDSQLEQVTECILEVNTFDELKQQINDMK